MFNRMSQPFPGGVAGFGCVCAASLSTVVLKGYGTFVVEGIAESVEGG